MLPDDQAMVCDNVEFFLSTLGERRRGCESISVASSDLEAEDGIVFLVPFQNETAPIQDTQLWAVATTENTSAVIAYRDTSGVWHTVTPSETFINTFPEILQIQAQSLHGKLFIAYKSSIDRLHVWDNVLLRKTGLTQPDPPTAANTVGAGAITGDRTYRVRYIEYTGGVINRRSEPSTEITFTPSGANMGVTVTRGTLLGEGETDWELEASDGDGNFYLIATTTIGTASVQDSVQPSTDYAITGPLSADIGDYTNVHSGKFIKVDQDRLIIAGSWEQEKLASRVSWTPVWTDPGYGNDERIPIDTDNFVDLDWADGGAITGLSDPLNGSFYAFKLSRIYKLQRSGVLDHAYEAFLMSKFRGAIQGSIVSGLDEDGRGCVYFLDPSIGPARISTGGIQAMKNLRGTWGHVNTSAANIVAHGVYYPDKQQVWWWLATDGEDTPTLRVISQVNEIRTTVDGTQRGWCRATGLSAEAWCSTIFPEIVIDENGSTVINHRPYMGFPSPNFIQRGDVTDADNGQEYRAVILTKPYILAGLLNRWGITAASLLARMQTNPITKIGIKLIRNFGIEEVKTDTDFLPIGEEPYVIKDFDNLHLVDARTIQIEFSDPE